MFTLEIWKACTLIAIVELVWKSAATETIQSIEANGLIVLATFEYEWR